MMSNAQQRWCAYGGLILMVVFLLSFWLIAGYVPPPSPRRTPDEVAMFYRENANSIRVGLILVAFAACWIVPWSGVLSMQMARIRRRYTPMCFAQFGMGVIAPVLFILPVMFWLIATYRPETRSPDLTYLLDDTGWLFFIVATFIFPPWVIAVAVSILGDDRENPLFPRWVAYFSLLDLPVVSAGCVAVFFTDGPLAWNGVICFWVVVLSFAVWISVMSILMVRVAERADEEVVEPPLIQAAVTP